MGKKTKGNKLANMTDEERARYLQHRADLEEEARRRKQQLIGTFIKNKLDKEEAYSRMNTAKINQAWRYILRKIKCKQMDLEIKSMQGSFNFMLDRKNRLLTTLVKSIDESDEQHRRAFHAHAESVHYFLDIGTQRLDKLQSEYDFQKNTLLETWDREEMELTEGQEQADFKLLLVTFIQDRDFKQHVKRKEIERATAKNEARLEHEEDLRAFARPKQLELEWYCSQLRSVYTSYIEQHKPMMSHYNSLREKDEFYQRDIGKNEVLIQSATENLLNLQREYMKMTANMESKLMRMSNHKEDLSKKYYQMKKDAQAVRAAGNKRLGVMVNASQDAIKRLDQVKGKLNKVLQLAEICKKYEHEGDEAFFKAIEDDAESVEYENLDEAMINPLEMGMLLTMALDSECKQYRKLDKFLLKVNRAHVQTMCLRAEKAKLARENVELKHYIKRYLTDMALKNKRPQSVEVKTVQKIDGGKLLNRPVTCIEGALSNAVLHEKRIKIFSKKSKDTEIRSFPRMQCWM